MHKNSTSWRKREPQKVAFLTKALETVASVRMAMALDVRRSVLQGTN
jgi:hypothetical protein